MKRCQHFEGQGNRIVYCRKLATTEVELRTSTMHLCDEHAKQTELPGVRNGVIVDAAYWLHVDAVRS